MSGLPDLVDVLRGLEAWRAVAEARDAGQDAQVFGVTGGLRAMAAAALCRDLARPALVVCPGWSEARSLEAELDGFCPGRVVLLPPRAVVYGRLEAESREWEHRRLEVFQRLRTQANLVVVAPIEAARQRQITEIVPPLRVARGDRIARDDLAAALTRLGYEREALAVVPGHFSVRGSIVDVVTPSQAVRVELWDDEVDLVALFDPETQRTGDGMVEAAIGPAREFIWSDAERDAALVRIGQEVDALSENLHAIGRADAARALRVRWDERLSLLLDGHGFMGIERAAAAFRPLHTLTELFPVAPLVILDDRERVVEALNGRAKDEREEQTRRMEHGDLLPVEGEAGLGPSEFLGALAGYAQISLSLLPHHRHHGQALAALSGRPAPRAHGQWDVLRSEIDRLRKARLRVVVVLGHDEALPVLRDRLLEAGVPVRPGLPAPGEVGLVVGPLTHGFVLPEAQLAVLTETELTGHEVRPANRPRRSVTGRALVRLNELTPGDYVVHVTHGVGRYQGIRTLDTGGTHKDYLHIAYAEADVLYVPVDQLDLVQKYAGPDDRTPRLSRLSGSEWQRTKERVKASVREMAQELLKLYAAREARPGFGFPPDTPWQKDFEAAFPYEETPDQLTAAEEIKRDMERPRPMDRLLLGDVGYGKTEVALRAAFKAIMAGKQVAILVPTTLLAEQHYATARERMAGFPIRVEVLSRFRSLREQRETLAGLQDGQVDLVVGTHRLLSQDVQFHDLGLLVVDEEHRFGVAHKERVKQLKETVDVVTLSATPIPRTLHMAIVGVRDMSVLETPPEDRFPVETTVVEYDEDVVREAIRRELEREGQVYYLQNRIRAMDRTLLRLRAMLPDLRVAVAHGQMDEDALEEVMTRFLNQEYDVLVTTTIIESGLDIPNVNTLVVEDADRLGLAQLYQLRGRVGRSSRLAYAYFTIRRDEAVTPEAEQRLAAIRDFTDLGAGYQIALRDLEIRGAGNLLGPEQHGFVAAVGFELYTQLLADAIREQKGEQPPAPVETTLELSADAYLPDDYIEDSRQKIACYKRLVSAASLDAVVDLGDELAERYGPLPEPVLTLLALCRVRVLARGLGLAQLTQRGDRLMLRLSTAGTIPEGGLMALAQRYPGRLIQMPRSPELGVRLRDPGENILALAEGVLATLSGDQERQSGAS